MDDAQWNSLDTSPGIPPAGGYPTAPPDAGGGGFGGAGGGDTTPQPPAPNAQPPWGQSLGSDVGRVGSAISGAIPQGGLEPNSGAIGSDTGDAMSQKMQGIKDYISGKGAMPKDQFEEMNKAVDPRGTMDQNERSMRMLDATANDPTQAASVIQALRQHWDVQRGNAAKLLTEGNATMAASEMSKGFQYVPDGTKTMVTPNKDGFTFTTHTMDGQDTTNYVDANQTKQFLTGQHGLFDHVVGQGTGTVLSSLSPPPPSGGGASAEAGGPPKDSFADTQVGDVGDNADVPYDPKGGIFADKSSYDPRADDPNADFGQGDKTVQSHGGKPVAIGQGTANMATPAQGNAYSEWFKAQQGKYRSMPGGGGESKPGAGAPADGTYIGPDGSAHKLSKGDTVDASNVVRASPSSLTYGNTDENAVAVVRGGVTNYEGGKKTPDQEESNRQLRNAPKANWNPGHATYHNVQNPGKNGGQTAIRDWEPGKTTYFNPAQDPGPQQDKGAIAAANNQSRERISAGNNQSREGIADRQIQGRQDVANTVAGTARQKIQQMLQGETDKTRAENLRTAVTNLGNAEKSGNTDVGSSIKAMRAAGLGDDVIGPLTRSTPQRRRLGGAPAQQAPQQDDQSGQDEFPQEAMQHLQEGVPTQFKNGQTWTMTNGKPVRVK